MKLFISVVALVFVPISSVIGQPLDFWIDHRAEARMLAVEITGNLRPSAILTAQIQADLGLIRGLYPTVADIRMFPAWQPGAVEVQLTPSAYNAYRNGTFTGFDALYSDLGTPTADLTFFDSSMRYLLLSFGQVYHGERLAELFRAAGGVSSAFPIGFAGDGDDIVARSDRTYTLSRGYGDCPAGCISRDAWTFAITNDWSILLIDQPGGGTLPSRIDPPQITLPEPATMVQSVGLFAAGIGLMRRRRSSRP